MVYKVVDEVTADCLEVNDIVQVYDDETDEYAYVVIEHVMDEDKIRILGFNADDDETEYDLYFDPDKGLNLYLDIDEE